jgi:hypothetical protein
MVHGAFDLFPTVLPALALPLALFRVNRANGIGFFELARAIAPEIPTCEDPDKTVSVGALMTYLTPDSLVHTTRIRDAKYPTSPYCDGLLGYLWGECIDPRARGHRPCFLVHSAYYEDLGWVREERSSVRPSVKSLGDPNSPSSVVHEYLITGFESYLTTFLYILGHNGSKETALERAIAKPAKSDTAYYLPLIRSLGNIKSEEPNFDAHARPGYLAIFSWDGLVTPAMTGMIRDADSISERIPYPFIIKAIADYAVRQWKVHVLTSRVSSRPYRHLRQFPEVEIHTPYSARAGLPQKLNRKLDAIRKLIVTQRPEFIVQYDDNEAGLRFGAAYANAYRIPYLPILIHHATQSDKGVKFEPKESLAVFRNLTHGYSPRTLTVRPL